METFLFDTQVTSEHCWPFTELITEESTARKTSLSSLLSAALSSRPSFAAKKGSGTASPSSKPETPKAFIQEDSTPNPCYSTSEFGSLSAQIPHLRLSFLAKANYPYSHADQFVVSQTHGARQALQDLLDSIDVLAVIYRIQRTERGYRASKVPAGVRERLNGNFDESLIYLAEGILSSPLSFGHQFDLSVESAAKNLISSFGKLLATLALPAPAPVKTSKSFLELRKVIEQFDSLYVTFEVEYFLSFPATTNKVGLAIPRRIDVNAIAGCMREALEEWVAYGILEKDELENLSPETFITATRACASNLLHGEVESIVERESLKRACLSTCNSECSSPIDSPSFERNLNRNWRSEFIARQMARAEQGESLLELVPPGLDSPRLQAMSASLSRLAWRKINFVLGGRAPFELLEIGDDGELEEANAEREENEDPCFWGGASERMNCQVEVYRKIANEAYSWIASPPIREAFKIAMQAMENERLRKVREPSTLSHV